MAGLILMWGTAFAAIRALGDVLTPLQITWFRYLPFIVLFGAWLLLRRRDRLARLTMRDWAVYLGLGILGVFGYHIPLYYAMQDGGPIPGPGAAAGTAAVLIATTPLWTMLFAALSGRESFDRRRLIGSLIAFGGVVVVVVFGRGEADLAFAKKASLVLLAPIFWSWYSILGKPLVDRDGGLFMTGLTMSLGTLFLVPYGITVGFEPLANFTGLQWFWIIYLSLAATVLGYAIWNIALRHRTASELTSWIYLIPVVATVAGWLLLDEAITPWFVGGAALVLLGVHQVNQARLKQTALKRSETA